MAPTASTMGIANSQPVTPESTAEQYARLWQESVVADAQGAPDAAWQAGVADCFTGVGAGSKPAQNNRAGLGPAPAGGHGGPPLNQMAARFQENGADYLARLDGERLGFIFETSVPQAFRVLVRTGGSRTARTIFPIKTCFALWHEVQALGLDDDQRFELFIDIAEAWQGLDEVFAQFEAKDLEPIYGRDFWYLLAFRVHINTVGANNHSPKGGAKDFSPLQDQIFFDLEEFLHLQADYAADKEFPRIFLASREVKGYGLPPNVSIPDDVQLFLYAVWRELDADKQPSVKAIRTTVKNVREKMEEVLSLHPFPPDLAQRLQDQQDIFYHILVTTIQGEKSSAENLIRDYDAIIQTGRAYRERVAQVEASRQRITKILGETNKNDERVMGRAQSLLKRSQNLDSWYNPFADPELHREANLEATTLSSEIAERRQTLSTLPDLEKAYQAELRVSLAARLELLRAFGFGEALIQAELYSAWLGMVPGVEGREPPNMSRAFSASYLKGLGLDFANFDNGDVFTRLVHEEKWDEAWSLLDQGVYSDFQTCSVEGDFATFVPESLPEKGGMAPAKTDPHAGKLVLDNERLAWRMDQMADLVERDPDFAAFDDFMTHTQPLMMTFHTLLMGMHDTASGTDLKGYLHPAMNRPEDAVNLLKSMANELYRTYYQQSSERTIALERSVKKLSTVLKHFDTEKMVIPPEQQQLIEQLKMLCELLTSNAAGKIPFKELLEAVKSPDFTTYTFERALAIYGPDLIGAVAGAVILGVVTGGPGAAAVGGSRLAAALRWFGTLLRSSAIMAAGSVAGKEIFRLGRYYGLQKDYGGHPLSVAYLKGEMTGDEVFASIFGEAGRELFVLFGFERENPDKGLGNLIARYESGEVGLNEFAYRLLGEYGYQAVTMVGVASLARGLGQAAAKMIASDNAALRLTGQSIKTYAGLFGSVDDWLATTGRLPSMPGKKLLATFGGEMAEEGIEMGAEQIHPALGWAVAVLNSSRVPDAVTTNSVVIRLRKEGFIVNRKTVQGVPVLRMSWSDVPNQPLRNFDLTIPSP